MRVEITRADCRKLDCIRGPMSRGEYVRFLIETRYAEDEKEWDERMKLHRAIKRAKYLLELAAKKEAKE